MLCGSWLTTLHPHTLTVCYCPVPDRTAELLCLICTADVLIDCVMGYPQIKFFFSTSTSVKSTVGPSVVTTLTWKFGQFFFGSHTGLEKWAANPEIRVTLSSIFYWSTAVVKSLNSLSSCTFLCSLVFLSAFIWWNLFSSWTFLMT